MRTSSVLCWLLLALAALQLAHAWVVLPDTVASHFGADGRADGYSSKAAFLAIMAVAVAITGVIFLALPPAIRGIPKELVNLPNRDFWLAEDRREATVADLGDRMAWFGVATLGLLVVINHLVIVANQGDEPRLDERAMWGLLAAYLAFTVVWLVRMIRHYATQRQQPAS